MPSSYSLNPLNPHLVGALWGCQQRWTLIISSITERESKQWRTPAWRRLSFICFEDPGALNKVQVRPILLRGTQKRSRVTVTRIFEGATPISISSVFRPTVCGRQEEEFRFGFPRVFVVLHTWNLCRTSSTSQIWSLVSHVRLSVLVKTEFLSVNSGFWLLWIFSFDFLPLTPTLDVNLEGGRNRPWQTHSHLKKSLL